MEITVIRLGRLGTVAASGLAAAGHEVTGLDIKEATVKAFDPKAGAAACEALPPSVEFVGAAEETAECAHALVLLAEWQEIIGADWEAIASRMRSPKFLFDGRNALDAPRMAGLGFEYAGVGRGNAAPLRKQN